MLEPRFSTTFLQSYHSFRQQNGLTRISVAISHTLSRYRGTSDPVYLQHSADVIGHSKSNIMVAFWGTVPLPDLIAIKKRHPSLRIIHMLLCYPLALTPMSVAIQHRYFQHASKYIDGLIFPSAEMADYFKRHVLKGRMPPAVIIPPCWPGNFQAATRASCDCESPNLIYVGRTDLDSSTIHAADDIRKLMLDILNAGITLHHVKSKETSDGHPRRKPFSPLGIRELIATLPAFDASLVAYNTAACSREDRFLLTVPDRLITSVAAGIPVAIPSRGYSASKSYLKEYPAVIEFDSPSDLIARLSDRDAIQRLKEVAWNSRPAFAARRHASTLQDFLASFN